MNYGWLQISIFCLAPIFVNKTAIWTKQDSRVFTKALFRCEEKYPNSPCLSQFSKTKENAYQAMCKDPYYYTKHTKRRLAFESIENIIKKDGFACKVQ